MFSISDEYFVHNVLGHFRIAFSLFLKASFGAIIHMQIKSFSYEWLCNRSCFGREAYGNSGMDH